MVDVAEHVLHNADVEWNRFSSDDYWQQNYRELQAEGQEINRLVLRFFIAAFRDRPRAGGGFDAGSGTNLYPALLMLPWTDRILLTDLSASNVRWLRHQLEPGYAGIERRSVFSLQKPRQDLGTTFFVAEDITDDPGEFRAVLARFTGALKPGSPFATAFMSGSHWCRAHAVPGRAVFRERATAHRHQRVQADSNERPS